ncbi:MAG: TetR/AcrR family transcriptional regulator [Oscillospiraceae bacterium]|nr:TetR/AcrR family transcriptional regulator [Oscillospiraceae bacterium]
MPRIPFRVRQLILSSAKEEFLAHGFEGASLRTICKKAGLTTGAFYNHFSQKEELFDALVAPMIEEFHGVYGSVMSRELEDLDTGVDNELTSITYAIAHRDEFRLLFECSRGTKYEGFKDELINEVFYPGYQAVFDRYAGRTVDPALVKLILKMKFEEYMELIYGEYTMAQVKTLITQISIFSIAGFHGLLKELNTES